MHKKLTAVFLQLVFAVLIFTGAGVCNTEAREFSFDERLLYGGYAVDADEKIYFADEDNSGFLSCREYGSDDAKVIVKERASYINSFENRLYFVTDDGIRSCAFDGTDLKTEYEGENISHLYVFDGGFYFMKDCTVYLFDGKREKEVFHRDDMTGFIPESENTFRWIKENPDYVYVEETGDEYWGSESEYFAYRTNTESGAEESCQGSPYKAESVDSGTSEYTGPYVKVGETTLPMKEHMPGTFFSKDGKACHCHNSSPTFCIESINGCNCMRYYPTGYKDTCEIDLLGAQCFAFARMVFYKCFGFIDHSMNQDLYYNVGSLPRGSVTPKTVKELMMKAAPGAHVRLAPGHSVSILTMDEDFIVIYHGNAGGDGVVAQPCVVSTRRYTWEQFANSVARGILYINMPYNYPDSNIVLSKKEPGYYRLNSNLNLRREHSTQSESLCIIPQETIIRVTDIDGFWGKVEFRGHEGWIFLEYTSYYSKPEITPTGGRVFTDEKSGYLVGRATKMKYDPFTENFVNQNLIIRDPDGNEFTDTEKYIGTGFSVSVTVGDEILDTKKLAVMGDVNGNGYVDVGDYLAVRRNVLGKYDLSDVYYFAGDVDADGKINASDYMRIKRYFLDSEEDWTNK